MTELALELDGGPRWHPGEALSGRVIVTEGGKSRSLRVSLAFVNQTSDYREPSVVIASAPLHEGELVAGTRLPFRLAIPPDAPPPHMAPWGRLFWEVDAQSDQFGPDAHARQEVLIAADGVPLPSGPPSDPAPTPPPPPGITTVIPPVGAEPQNPGWYPDPWLRWRLRYWDGARWTADVLN